MEVANTLAYYYMATNTTLKSFTVLAPDLQKMLKLALTGTNNH
jgi:hypothetical protein